MPGIYKIITGVLGVTGSISLMITGELNFLFLIPGLAVFPGYYRYYYGHSRGYDQPPRRAIGGLSAAALGLLVFDGIAVSGDFFLAIAHMTIVFQAIKSFDLRDPWDHLQVYFMSLLQLVITSELSHSVVVGAVFAAFLFVFIAAMVLAHFIKERTIDRVRIKRPLIFISIAALSISVLFFVSVPRVGGGMLGGKGLRGIRSVGFTEKVDFGSFGNVLLDPTVVMRVEVSGPKLPRYWRGLTLDYFDGNSWQDTLGTKTRVNRSGDRGFVLLDKGGGESTDYTVYTGQRIYAEPMDTAVLFGLGEIVRVEAQGHYILRDDAGALFMPSKRDKRFSYTVYSLNGEGPPVYDSGRYLSLPAGMEKTDGMQKIYALSNKVAAGAGDLERAMNIEKFLKTNYAYDLKTMPPPEGMTPIEGFLFDSKRGFCEHFATAMVLMLRSQGIPARFVTGFAGGEENDFGDYVILRQSNAHSWVEAAIGGRWLTFDPTPPIALPVKASSAFLYLDALRMKWYRYVVGFSRDDQKSIIRAVSMPVLKMPEIGSFKFALRPIHIIGAALIVFIAGSVLFLRGVTFKRYSSQTRRYLRFRRNVRKKGGKINGSSTPAEVLKEAVRVGMDAEASGSFIRAYEDARFGVEKPHYLH